MEYATPATASDWSYPAIAACLCSGRRPSRQEVRTVALRIWRESFGFRSLADASFGTRRLLVRSAMAALAGMDVPASTRFTDD